MSKAWKQGSTRAWRRTRALVLLRDAGKGCRAHRDGWCAQVPGRRAHQCTNQQDEVHHTRGKAHGDNPRYLVASCTPCNQYIGDPSKHTPPPRRVSNW